MPQITTAARRIASRLNEFRGQGGFCVFGADGSGGYHYTDGSRPTLASDHVRFACPGRSNTTARYIQDRLDDLQMLATMPPNYGN